MSKAYSWIGAIIGAIVGLVGAMMLKNYANGWVLLNMAIFGGIAGFVGGKICEFVGGKTWEDETRNWWVGGFAGCITATIGLLPVFKGLENNLVLTTSSFIGFIIGLGLVSGYIGGFIGFIIGAIVGNILPNGIKNVIIGGVIGIGVGMVVSGSDYTSGFIFKFPIFFIPIFTIIGYIASKHLYKWTEKLRTKKEEEKRYKEIMKQQILDKIDEAIKKED